MLLWGMLTRFSSCICQATTVFKYVVCIDFLKKIQIRVQKISFARKKGEKTCSLVIAVQDIMVIPINNTGCHGEGGAGREKQFDYIVFLYN